MCFYWDDCETAQVSQQEIRRARKPHKCCDCGKPVQPGQFYLHDRWLLDGRWDSAATCGQCECLRFRIHEVELSRGCNWTDSWCPPGQLRDALSEDDEYAAIPKPTVEDGQKFFADKRVVNSVP